MTMALEQVKGHLLTSNLKDRAALIAKMEELSEWIRRQDTAPFIRRDIGEEEINLLDHLPSMIWRAGRDSQRNFFNLCWLNFTGKSLPEESGPGWLEGIHRQDVGRFRQVYAQSFQAQEPFELEYRLRHHSGEYRWVLDLGRPYFDRQGEFAGYLGACFDLSEYKKMENALYASETKFKGLFEYAPDGVVVIDRSGLILLVNQRIQAMFGYSLEELIHQPIEVLMPEGFHKAHRRHVQDYMVEPRVRPMGNFLSLFGQRKNGEMFPVDVTLGPLETVDGFMVLATIRDISERKQSEVTLREREQLLISAARSTRVEFMVIDQHGTIQYSIGHSLSRALYDLDPVGKPVNVVCADAPQFLESYRRALAGETAASSLEVNGVAFDVTCNPIRNSSGAVTGVAGVAFDITHYRQVQNELKESVLRFRNIFDNAIEGMELINLEGRIIEANPAFQEMLGYSAEEIKQKTYAEITHPDDLTEIQRFFEDLVHQRIDYFRMEKRYLHKGGSVLWGRLVLSLFRNEEGAPQYAIGLVENISARKNMEAELAEVKRRLSESVENERLSLAQELHDGPLQDLQVVVYQFPALEEILENNAEGIATLTGMRAQIQEVAASIRSICGDLRPPALAPFGLEKAIRSHADRFQDQHAEFHIQLDLMKDGQLLPERVRLALFRIYQHAMTNILRHSKANQVSIRFWFNAEEIGLTIEDNGQGFDVPKRWVEMARQGHFGLVGSKERVESIGGRMDIQAYPGKGTSIQVLVPRDETYQVAPGERYSTLLSQM
ncbi:MAG: PAS domain S-box protein [Chloroflexi bacterium]|nr:PAS domain S-box protein [Chloroflexota bacterium]